MKADILLENAVKMFKLKENLCQLCSKQVLFLRNPFLRSPIVMFPH
jgi:hypothetical protein